MVGIHNRHDTICSYHLHTSLRTAMQQRTAEEQVPARPVSYLKRI